MPPKPSAAPSPFIKLARISGPWSGDAVTFWLTKMKQDGFTGIVVTITPDDWRLQRALIVRQRLHRPHPLAIQ